MPAETAIGSVNDTNSWALVLGVYYFSLLVYIFIDLERCQEVKDTVPARGTSSREDSAKRDIFPWQPISQRTSWEIMLILK